MLLAFALGAGVVYLYEHTWRDERQAEGLMATCGDSSRFISTDALTDRLVKQDPALLVVDVRPGSDFKLFAIPGALHIPADSILTPAAQRLLRKDGMDKVFYSNAAVLSDQVWVLCRRLGIPQIYVLQGGVNQWFKDIVKAEAPADLAPAKAQELYRFRMAARQHFFGVTDAPGVNPPAAAPKPKKTIKPVKKAAPASSEEGC